MNAVATWLTGVTALYAAGLLVDALLARRRPLVAGAVWNAVLVAALVLGPAVWLLPRWELVVLPAEVPVALGTGSLDAQPAADDTIAEFAPAQSPAAVGEMPVVRVPTELAEPVTKVRRERELRHVDGRVAAGMAIVAVYLGGVGILLGRLLLNVAAVARLRRRAALVACDHWDARLEFWRQQVGLRRPVAILRSEAAQVPIVLGWWRPAIVIPESLVGCQNQQTVDAVLVHELAHVQRADCGWQLVEHVAQAIYWFHPLLWLASRRMAAVRERACDDLAIYLLADRDAYAETLLAMAERMVFRQRLGLAMAVVRSSKLEKRLAAIATSRGAQACQISRRFRWLAGGALLAATVTGSAVRLVNAQSPPARPSTPPPAGRQTTPPESPSGSHERRSVGARVSDATRGLIPEEQKDVARRLFHLLKEKKYAEAEELLAPQLKEVFNQQALAKLVDSLTEQLGPLRENAVLLIGRIGNQDVLDLTTGWGVSHRLSLRLLFDAENRIDGIWVANSSLEEPQGTPPVLRWPDERPDPVGMVLGESMKELAKQASLSLTLNLVAENGPIAPSAEGIMSIQLYRALGSGEERRTSDHWHDSTTGTTWRLVEIGRGNPLRIERLMAGIYRAFWLQNLEQGYGLSEPIVLDGSQNESTFQIRVTPGANLVARVVDEETGLAVENCDVRLQADDPRIPSCRHGSSFNESTVNFKGMLPGRHRISAHRQAAAAGKHGDYEQVESPQYVELEAGKTVEVTVKLRATPMTSEERARRWPFVVTGNVLDGDGKPVAGAEVKAMCGIGTLRRTGTTNSDAEGNFRLQFGPGLWSPDGTIAQAAVVSANKEGSFEKNLGAQGQLMITDKLPPEAERGGQTFVLPHTPQEVNFVLVPAARVSAEFVDAQGKVLPEFKMALAGKQLPPASSVLADGKTDVRGEYRVERLPVGYAFWWWHDSRGESPSRSLPFALPRAGEYRMRVQLTPEAKSGLHKLVLLQVLDSAERDVTGEVIQDDLLQRDPLNAEGQLACQDFVDKMLRANRLWLAPPADDIQYRFELQFDAIGDDRRMAFEHPESIPTAGRHGVMYASPLAALGNAKNVVYRALEVKPGKAVLAYTFKQPARIAVGNGVDTMWRGSITAASREGILTLDTSRFVPLRVEGDRLVEHFDEYREVTAGQFVPQRVRIDVVDTKDFAFDWSFAVYEPGIWMFEKSRNVRQREAPPIVRLENLQIGGEAAKRLAEEEN